MCVVCNSVESVYSKTAYLAVETDKLDTLNVPVIKGLLENHSLESIDALLINACLIVVIF